MKRNFLYFLLCIALLCALAGCGKEELTAQDTETYTLSEADEFDAFYLQYLTAFQSGTADSAPYLYFADEALRSEYLASGDRLLDYTVRSAAVINDNLKEYTLIAKTFSPGPDGENGEEEMIKAYHFVGRIDGQLYVINSVTQIPESLTEGLDPELYTYSGEDLIE